jgi:hypothetical protein
MFPHQVHEEAMKMLSFLYFDKTKMSITKMLQNDNQKERPLR